jgi:hypothetical protein
MPQRAMVIDNYHVVSRSMVMDGVHSVLTNTPARLYRRAQAASTSFIWQVAKKMSPTTHQPQGTFNGSVFFDAFSWDIRDARLDDFPMMSSVCICFVFLLVITWVGPTYMRERKPLHVTHFMRCVCV